MKAVLMAGGEGTRLRPLTCGLPKPMVPVMDKPIMEYGLELLRQNGVSRIGITLQYLGGAIERHFNDGSEFGLDLTYYMEETPLGTAGSVGNARDFLDETFIVMSGDALTDFPLQEAVDFHRERGGLATLVLTRVHAPLEYGLVLTDGDGRVQRFLEKPSWGEVFSDTVNTGIYILEPEVLDYIKKHGGPADFSRDIFPRLLNEKRGLYGCVLKGYWCDVGTLEQYRQVHADMLDGRTGIRLTGERNAHGIWSRHCHISSRARIEGPVFIGDGCEIGEGAHIFPYTVLGRGCVIEKGASIKRSILWPGAWIGKRAQIRGAVIGQGAKIGQGSSLFENSVIGDGCILEAENLIRPDVKIWPHKYIESRRIIHDSMVWNERGSRVLFGRNGICGELNMSMTPERIARIGRAVGSSLPVSTRVICASDWSAAGYAAKNAFQAGLISTGVEMLDPGRLLLTALRYGCRELEAESGFYLGLGEDENHMSIQFVNKSGADLTKLQERKIENLFLREEYRLIHPEHLHEPSFLSDITTGYLYFLTRNLDVKAIRSHGFKIVVGARTIHETNHLVLLLDRLGCAVVRVDGISRVPTPSLFDKQAVLNVMLRCMAREDVSMGIFLEESGQRLTVITPSGEIIPNHSLTVLLIYILRDRFNKVFLPITAPVAVEGYLHKKGISVVRTRSAQGDFMAAMVDEGEIEQLSAHTDGLYAAARLLEYLARKDTNVTELLALVPSFHCTKRDVAVPWDNIGKVIRRLAQDEDFSFGFGDVPEGVRMEVENGTSLILPDAERPVCSVYSEAFSQEIAESLNDLVEEKIRRICQEEDL